MEQSSRRMENQENDFEEFDPNAITTFQDAANYLTAYLNRITTHTNDGSSHAINQLEDTLRTTLAYGLHYPEWVEHHDRDAEISRKIISLHWLTPEHLDCSINIQDTNTITEISTAIHELARMTMLEDPFEKLKSLVLCCRHTTKAIGQNENGADELMPTLKYVILKTNPPKLASNLEYLSSLIENNWHMFKGSHEISKFVPKLCGSIMDCCWTNIYSATSSILSIDADEETGRVLFPPPDLPLNLEYKKELNKCFESVVTSAFEDLERKLKDLIECRITICENHREDMTNIADTLEKHVTRALAARSGGLLMSIGGGIVSVIGFSFIFTTFGVSSVLIPIGLGVGGFGGLVAVGSSITEYGITKSKTKEIQEKRVVYERNLKDVFTSLRRIEKLLIKYLEKSNVAIKASSEITLRLSDIVLKLSRTVVALYDASADATTTAFRAAGAASKGLAVTGLVFSALMIPIDMIFLGFTLKQLTNEQKSQQASAIREWLDEPLPSNDDISKVVGKLRDAVIDHAQQLRDDIGGNQEQKVEINSQLKASFDEVLNLI